MEERMHQWSDLPSDLVQKIAELLNSPIVTLSLRAVCTSWRSSLTLPSFDQEIPRLILNLPFPLHSDAVLSRTSICRLQLTHSTPNFSSVKSKGWLTVVRPTTTGQRQLLHPISGVQFRYSSIPLISSQEIQFVQLYEAYKLELVKPDRIPLFGVFKVIPFPSSAANCADNKVAFVATFCRGKLGYWKYGDENLKLLGDETFQYDDIIEFKGQVYAVDRLGTVFWIDPLSLNLIQYSPLLINGGGGCRKSLVESCGDLYVVDRYLNREWNNRFEDSLIAYRNVKPEKRIRRQLGENKPKAKGFRVYKLDEEFGRWLDVKSLGDQIFVLNMYCSFSISSSEYVGGKGNCIYFTDDDDVGLIGDKVRVRVFLLENGSIKKLKRFPEFSEIFLSPNIGF